MAWNKTTWGNVIGSDVSKQNITAGNSSIGTIDCNLASPQKFLSVSIKAVIDFGASPDGNAEILVFGIDSDGANEQDTIPMFRQDIEYIISTEQIITLPNLDTSALDSLIVEVKNKDSADSIDVWVSFMAGYTDEIIGSTPGLDEKAKVSINDTLSDYLENKIIGTTDVIEATVINEGANEKLKINIGKKIYTATNERYEVITVTVNAQVTFNLSNTPEGKVRMIPLGGPELVESIDFSKAGSVISYIAATPSFAIGEKILFKYFG